MIDVKLIKKRKNTGVASNSGITVVKNSQELTGANKNMRLLSSLLVPVDAEGNELAWDDANIAVAIKAKKSFFSEGGITALGVGTDSEATGNAQAYGRLDEWSQYVETDGYVLSAKLGVELKNSLDSHSENSTIHITASERSKWNATTATLNSILGSDASGVLDKWDEIKAFLATYTEADTLAGLLSNKADKSTQIKAGTGLTGGGTLAADRTLSLATSGVTAGTYTKVTVDKYGRTTSGASLAATDIPALDWSKITTGKPTTLAGYGITDVFTKDEANAQFVDFLTAQIIKGVKTFENGLKIGTHLINADANGDLCIDGNVYATGGITALGSGGDAGSGSGGGVSELRLLSDVLLTNPAVGQALVFDGSMWVNQKVGVDASTLANYVTLGTAQTIMGEKTFADNVRIADGKGIIFNRATAVSFDGYGNIYRNNSGSTWNVFKEDKSTALLKLSLSTGDLTILGKIVKSGGTSAQFLKADGSVTEYSALENAFVKKSGDTMTGTLYFGSTNAGIYNSGNILALKAGDGIDKLVITADTVRRSTQTATMNLGTADIRWNTLYANTINVTSTTMVSNLNADMLDGVHYANILERSQSLTFRQVASDATAHWYRVGVTLLANNSTAQSIVSIGRSYWSPQNEGYVFAISVGYGNDINIAQLSGVQGSPLIDKIRVVWSNNAVAYLDVHVKYPGNTSYTNAINVTSIGALRTFSQSEVLADPSTAGYNVYEYNTHAGMGSNSGLFGNASSATKLQTARTLWGQSFNGTADISGTMSGVRHIVGTDTMAPLLRMVAVPSDAGHLGLAPGVSIQGESYGLYFWNEGNGRGHIQVGRNDGTSATYPLVLQSFGGNVGIGMVPYYNLDVNGTARVASLIIGNATLSWDSSESAMMVNQNFFSTKGITALASASTSDMREKDVVRNIELDIKNIAAAPCFIHRWKDPEKYAPGEYAGTSAQYWQGVLPQVVSGKKWLALDYGKAAMVSAIAIARKTVSLECRVKTLEIENKSLKEKLNLLTNSNIL